MLPQRTSEASPEAPYELKGFRRQEVILITLGGLGEGGLTHMRYRRGSGTELGASRPHEEGLSHFFHFRHKAIRASELLDLALAGEKVRPETWAVPTGWMQGPCLCCYSWRWAAPFLASWKAFPEISALETTLGWAFSTQLGSHRDCQHHPWLPWCMVGAGGLSNWTSLP